MTTKNLDSLKWAAQEATPESVEAAASFLRAAGMMSSRGCSRRGRWPGWRGVWCW